MSEYTITNVAAQTVLSTIQTSTLADFKELFGVWLPKVYQYAMNVGATIAGAPFARYHQFDNEAVIIELGLPILGSVTGNSDFAQREIPASKVLGIKHIGAYDDLNKAWSALANSLKEQGLEYNGPCWESYVTDPSTESDPNKWVTELYQPIK